jgi:hypothetical protein
LKAEIKELQSRAQTGRSIYRSAKYFKDLGIHLDDSLQQFFNHVRAIPYKEDGLSAEVVSRPKYLLGNNFPEGIDCKKKAVLIGSWLNAHNIPWRLVAVSERKDKKIHHVFNQAQIQGEWKNIDATYPSYKLFESKPGVTAGEKLPR